MVSLRIILRSLSIHYALKKVSRNGIYWMRLLFNQSIVIDLAENLIDLTSKIVLETDLYMYT